MGRVYISIDAEGLPGIFHPSQLEPGGKMFKELQSVMGRVVDVLGRELSGQGFGEIWVADSHGFMGNIDYTSLPRGVTLVRGSLRPTSMVYGIDRGFDAAMFIGYHPGAGTPRGVLEHTYSGRVFWEVRVDGARASEMYINALVAGHYGVPVILVAGDDRLRGEVEERLPWAVYIALKESVSRFATVSRDLETVLEELREGAREAVTRLREGRAKPLRHVGPLKIEFVFRRQEYADAAELIPGVKRVDTYTIETTAQNPLELYRVLELATLASLGLETLIRSH